MPTDSDSDEEWTPPNEAALHSITWRVADRLARHESSSSIAKWLIEKNGWPEEAANGFVARVDKERHDQPWQGRPAKISNRRCFVNEGRVEIKPPFWLGSGFAFDGGRQQVTIRRCVFGLSLSEQVIPFSDIGGVRLIRFKGEGPNYHCINDLIELQVVHGGIKVVPVLHVVTDGLDEKKAWPDRERLDQLVGDIERLGIPRAANE